jgi:GNAT superfamily N-acetyltransferase
VRVEIRAARPEEYPAVGALTVECYVGGGFTRPESPYVAQLADAERRAREAELLVAVDGADALLGSVTFIPPGSPYGEITDPAEAGIRMLLVRTEARGRGVGAALVRACLDRARALGCAWVRLSTQQEMDAAHRLYERLGFVRTPDRDWSPQPGLLLLTYALELP